MMLMGEIRRAIRDRELELQYQRIVECATGRTARFEALLRWRHPALGLLQTGDLVDMMELSNLNSDLVRYCLELAIDQCKEWQADGILIPISINVGGATVHDVELVDFIISSVTAAALPPLTIGVELAERNLLLGSGISAESTRRLSQAGVWISIDHFGTGTSPLAALPHVSANGLKMGKGVVDDLCGGSGSVLRALAMVIHNLGLVFGVSGVDDSATPQWLIENGADRMQGSAIGEPLSGRELRQHMSTEFTL
jgi:EAL domain-containing protein (putative c-di-GMP-specific phosphodiesterase class I)